MANPASHIATLILSKRDGKKDHVTPTDSPPSSMGAGNNKDEGMPEGLKECMEELSEAMEAKDFEKAAKVFQSAFDVLEAKPHKEADHSEDESEE